MSTSGMLRSLQGWIGVVGCMALGNTISCFRGHQYLADRLYTGSPFEVSSLSARLFGVWTLLSGILRIYCAFHIRNKQIYNMTFVTFVLAFIHFISEVFYYKSALLTIGVATPLAVSGVSIVWMVIGYWYLEPTKRNPIDAFDDDSFMEELLTKKKKKRR